MHPAEAADQITLLVPGVKGGSGVWTVGIGQNRELLGPFLEGQNPFLDRGLILRTYGIHRYAASGINGSHGGESVEVFGRRVRAFCPEPASLDKAYLSKGNAQSHRIRTMDPNSRLLEVSFESQLDNAGGQGYRECFSSSAAMLAKYHGRTTSDDAYNKVRRRFGDTTSAQAQVAALRALGLRSHLWTNGRQQDIRSEILGGRPVAVGWLHHGSPMAPTGAGHWSVVVGFDPAGVWMNDPNGEADLVRGGYLPNRNGAGLKYSWRNWLPRWQVEGVGTGWYLTCSP